MEHDFRYISKHDPQIKECYKDLVCLIHEVQKLVKDRFTFQFYPVGSYKRNMITYDSKSNVGFDFDINIVVNDDDNDYSPKQIREIIQMALNQVVKKYHYDYPEGSTRVLTIKVKDTKHSKVLYSCDFAIVNDYRDDDGYDCQEYIRYQKNKDFYYWYEQPEGYYMLPQKIEWIKENGLWGDVRELYIVKKNRNSDPNVHSRTIFANTVHEICQQAGFYDDE